MTGTDVATDGRATPVRTAAERLQRALDTREPCAPVRALFASPTVADGYAVQSLLVAIRRDRGARAVGRKVGLTSPAVQAQLGVDQPDSGFLFDDMACAQDEPISVARLMQPRIEAEVAFVLGEDLDHAEVDTARARAAVAEVVAALEIVDSRIAGWDITITDTVADNASSGLFVLGDGRRPLDDLDLREVAMSLTDGTGAVVSTGSGAACLGDPVAALAWLARTAHRSGEPLRSGDVVLSGALGPVAPVGPGSSFTATLSGLGTVSARFTS